ncbi:proteasome-interacting protein Cic1p [[Candida] railenensis]|uniref:Proteasome-interacting protein Cic1p n=1 Tax=[Candida] railenensis TaxID=45579 RepID=A0A9P0VYU2_9ASCO|nr:proteasome-interacting protein Cic1p [[Candida] railenensis]
MAKTRSQVTPTKKAATPTKSPKKSAAAAAAVSAASASPSVKKTKKAPAKKAVPAKKEQAKTPAKETKKATAKTTTKATKITKASDSIVSPKVASKAISELTKYIKNESTSSTTNKDKTSLFDDADENDNSVYLQVTTKKFFSANVNLKPKQIKLSHSIKEKESLRTCLIIRDSLITTDEQLEKIEAENFETLKQIVPMKDLKKEYKPYEKRRQFYSDFDLFLVDDACLNMLPQALGKTFYGNGTNSTKAPLPVKVTSSSKPKEFSIDTFKNQLNKVLTSTSFLPPVGVNVSIKFGTLDGDLKETELVDNLLDVLKGFNKEDLRSVMVKTSTSPALPLYYAETLFTETDVLEEEQADKKTKKTKSGEVKLSAFEKGLLELGDADEVAKIIGKKMSQTNSKKPVGKIGKVQKV